MLTESTASPSSTPKNVSALPVLIAVLLVVACSGATYLATQHFVYADAYAAGRAAGMTDGQKSGYDTGYAAGQAFSNVQYNQLVDKYNGLVGDYNTLRTAVIKYIGATSYQSRSAISCTSNTLGAYTYTNCY